ncbi:MAG TPA: HIT domain-containing protein [Kineosporiaceae bacterium]
MRLPVGPVLPYANTMADCFFCAIADGSAGVNLLVSGGGVVAFRDINPQAPTHVLVIPVAHYPDVAGLGAAEPEVLAELVRVAQQIADAEAGGEFRLVFNTGAGVGQSVFHVHGHVLAGRGFGWPPG